MGDHHHHHAPTSDRVDRAFLISLTLNGLLVAVQAIVGFTSGSLALLADAGHNLSDVVALVLGLVAVRLGRRPSSDRRTFGLSRAGILAAVVNAAALLAVCIGIAWEAVVRLQNPEPVAYGWVIAAAALGVLINGGTALLFLEQGKRDLNLRAAFLHLGGDAAISLGVILAGFAIQFTGQSWIDPVVSLAITLFIGYSTWSLLRESVDLMLDAVPDHISLPQVDAFLRNQPGVADLHDLHVWAMSTHEAALTVHLVMPTGHPGDDWLHQLCHELHDRFDIDHPTIQIETAGEQCRLRDRHQNR